MSNADYVILMSSCHIYNRIGHLSQWVHYCTTDNAMLRWVQFSENWQFCRNKLSMKITNINENKLASHAANMNSRDYFNNSCIVQVFVGLLHSRPHDDVNTTRPSIVYHEVSHVRTEAYRMSNLIHSTCTKDHRYGWLLQNFLTAFSSGKITIMGLLGSERISMLCLAVLTQTRNISDWRTKIRTNLLFIASYA